MCEIGKHGLHVTELTVSRLPLDVANLLLIQIERMQH